METINSIFKQGIYKPTIERKRVFNWSMAPDDFRKEFMECVHHYGFGKPYIIDNHNQKIINQLYHFLSNSDKFNGDLLKGILFLGKIGCGKTLLMDGFLRCFEVGSDKTVTRLHAKDIQKSITEKGIEYFYQRPAFIDDIGKEPTEAKNYGNDSKPFEDLISARYRYRSVIFGTSNLTLNDMPYSLHTVDRMKEMFNIIVMDGDSRRK